MYYISTELAVYGVSLIVVWLLICLYLKLQGVRAGLNQMTTITRLLKSLVRIFGLVMT